MAVVSALALARPALSESALVLRDFVLTRGVYQREPVDSADWFELSDGRVFVFARFDNEGPFTSVTFVWHYGAALHAVVDMDVGTSPGWRTWSSANLKPGDWRVELVTSDGVILAERAFTVMPSMETAPAPAREISGPDEGGPSPRDAPISSEYPGADAEG